MGDNKINIHICRNIKLIMIFTKNKLYGSIEKVFQGAIFIYVAKHKYMYIHIYC